MQLGTLHVLCCPVIPTYIIAVYVTANYYYKSLSKNNVVFMISNVLRGYFPSYTLSLLFEWFLPHCAEQRVEGGSERQCGWDPEAHHQMRWVSRAERCAFTKPEEGGPLPFPSTSTEPNTSSILTSSSPPASASRHHLGTLSFKILQLSGRNFALDCYNLRLYPSAVASLSLHEKVRAY